MSTKQDIWMPLYIADYLADTTRLNTEQHGAYLLLIMDYWRNGAPPNDDDVLANITRLSVQQWRKHKAILLKLFVINDGVLTHKRIEDELLKASDNAEKYAERAKKAAAKRWGKESSSNATSIPSSNPKEELEDMLADATSPSPSPTYESSDSECKSNTVPINENPKTHTQIQIGLIAEGLTAIGMMPFNPALPKFLTLIEAGATVEEFVATALEKKGTDKFNFSYLLTTMINRRQEAAEAKPLHKGALPSAALKPQSIHDKRSATAKAMFGDHENANDRPRIIDVSDYTAEPDRPLISAHG